jgi:hypothetical protein
VTARCCRPVQVDPVPVLPGGGYNIAVSILSLRNQPMKFRQLLPLCALALLPVSAAWSQTPAAAAAATTKNPCVKPDEYPGGRVSTDNQRKQWQKTMDTYGACIKTFIDEQRAITEAATKSANEAVGEYNAVAAKAKEEMQKSTQ